ncbi:MAG: S8 family serine peptidase [Phycisphaera sp.]|nr:MAG: S8 family serine peptidase [Phycisphaera sp.]
MKHHTAMAWLLLASVGLGSWAGQALATGIDQAPLEPRQPFAKADLPARPAHEHRLTVKFHDRVRARVGADERLVSENGVDLTELQAELAGAAPGDAAVGFRPLIDMPRADLEQMLQEAAGRSGRAQPDLGGMMAVVVDDGAMEAVARVLHASDLVEVVYYEALRPALPGWWQGGPDGCVDIAPITAEFFARQGYHNASVGIGMAAAWDHPGGRGQGVNVADCEYWFDGDHEDICGVIPEPGQTPAQWIIDERWFEHGTAVLGEMIGGDNGYGVTGLVPDAQAYFFPEWTIEAGGGRRVAAISRAVGTMGEGDVILLEMQDFGPGGDYAPAEINPLVWQITRVGTDRGVTIVAAAGNGDQDLDSGPYAEYRSRGDSGAIIVGAGSSSGSRSRLGFSTYGSRVNVQAWGQNVFTAGYGDFIRVGGDELQSYTQFFSGTSSASPIVASAAVSLQGIHRAATGQAMAPDDLRQLLIDSGRPQGGGQHIGPLPDMAAAVDALLGGLCPADIDGDGSLTLFDFLAFQTAFDAGEPVADFDGDGSLTIFDFLAFQTAFDAGCG